MNTIAPLYETVSSILRKILQVSNLTPKHHSNIKIFIYTLLTSNFILRDGYQMTSQVYVEVLCEQLGRFR